MTNNLPLTAAYFLFPFTRVPAFRAVLFGAGAFVAEAAFFALGLRSIQSITASANSEHFTSLAPFIRRAKS